MNHQPEILLVMILPVPFEIMSRSKPWLNLATRSQELWWMMFRHVSG
jgi:hypothetical protein